MLNISNLLLVFSIFIISYKSSALDCEKFQKWTNGTNQTISLNDSVRNSNIVFRSFLKNIDKQLVSGRAVLIKNPYSNIEVLQPNNDNEGCAKHILALPSHTGANADNCEVVINAGLFKTSNGECYGNVINNGKMFVNFGGIRTAHFGIKKDHSLFFGYLSEEEVLANQFQILVGGAIWLLRDGKSVVQESVDQECSKIQETGSLIDFAKVRSARAAVGALANGTVVLMTVNGKTWKGGVNLFEMADLLTEMGVISAINLDGGGSATMVVNGTLVSQPSDELCGIDGDTLFTCERKVSTVLCVRSQCTERCSIGHVCVRGECKRVYRLRLTLVAVGVGGIILLIVALFATRAVVRYCRRYQHYQEKTHRDMSMDQEEEAMKPLMVETDEI